MRLLGPDPWVHTRDTKRVEKHRLFRKSQHTQAEGTYQTAELQFVDSHTLEDLALLVKTLMRM